MSDEKTTSSVIAVDLDGTLVTVDSMEEALGWMWRHKPLGMIALVMLKLVESRAMFKWELYGKIGQEVVEKMAGSLNAPLVEWLRQQKAAGRKIILVSATPQFYVEAVGRRINEANGNVIDEFYGSPQTENRRAKKKAKFLVEKFGPKSFDYVGNSQADIPVWVAAANAYNVNPSKSLKTAARLAGLELIQIAENPQSELMERWDDFIRVMGVFRNIVILGAFFILLVWIFLQFRK